MQHEARGQQAQSQVILCSSCRPVWLKGEAQDFEGRSLCIACGERSQNGLALYAPCAPYTTGRRRQVIQLPENEFALFAEIRKNPLRDGLYEISMDAPDKAFPGSKYPKQLAQSAKKELVRRGVLEVVTVGGPQRRTVVRILNDNVHLSTGRGRPRHIRLQPSVVSEPKVAVWGVDDVTRSALVLSSEDRASDSPSLNFAGQGAAMPNDYEALNDRTDTPEASAPHYRSYTKRLRTFSQQTENDIVESVKTIGIVRTAHQYNTLYVYVSKLCKSRGIAIPLGRMKKAA